MLCAVYLEVEIVFLWLGKEKGGEANTFLVKQDLC